MECTPAWCDAAAAGHRDASVFARARQGIGTRAGVAVMAVAAHKQILFTVHTQTAAAIQIFRYSGIRNAGFKWQESEVSDLDLIHM